MAGRSTGRSSDSAVLSKRRQIRGLENELDKFVETERKAKEGKRRVKDLLRNLRGRR